MILNVFITTRSNVLSSKSRDQARGFCTAVSRSNRSTRWTRHAHPVDTRQEGRADKSGRFEILYKPNPVVLVARHSVHDAGRVLKRRRTSDLKHVRVVLLSLVCHVRGFNRTCRVQDARHASRTLSHGSEHRHKHHPRAFPGGEEAGGLARGGGEGDEGGGAIGVSAVVRMEV